MDDNFRNILFLTKDKRRVAFEEFLKGYSVYSGTITHILDELEKTGFYEAPASKKYHLNVPGGLMVHTMNVVRNLMEYTGRLELSWGREISPLVVAIMHDLCKADGYTYQKGGEWIDNPEIIYPGHGELSVMLAQNIITLTDEEIACIYWHMGPYVDKEKWNMFDKAVRKYPNILWLHQADMVASKIDEDEE